MYPKTRIGSIGYEIRSTWYVVRTTVYVLRKHYIRPMTFESLCARDYFSPEELDEHRAHILPIYQTSTFVYESAQKAMDVFAGKEEAFIYSRWSNPTVEAVERKIAALEAFELKGDDGAPLVLKALLFSSGMAAISSLLMALLKPGQKLLTSGNIYGTTVELMQVPLQEKGMEPVFTNLNDLAAVEAQLSSDPTIRVVYVECPTNPTITVYDLEVLARLAHAHSALLVVDNTFSSPYLQQPFRWGADYVVHSTTKYLNGHGTALGGVCIGRDMDFMRTKVWQTRKLFGGNSNALEAWLLNNGIKTLPLRMQQHCRNAQQIAEWLQAHPAVASVGYPGLSDHPQHALAQKQMRLPGGMVSFELKGGLEAGKRLMDRIRFCTLTSTLGTPDTLITHPASMTHVQVPRAQREAFGISDGLIRLSVGLEGVDDVLADLEQGLRD